MVVKCPECVGPWGAIWDPFWESRGEGCWIRKIKGVTQELLCDWLLVRKQGPTSKSLKIFEDENRFLEGCKIAMSTRGDSGHGRGKVKHEHPTTMSPGLLEHWPPRFPRPTSSGAWLASKQRRSGGKMLRFAGLCLAVSTLTSSLGEWVLGGHQAINQGLERSRLTEGSPWICFQRVTLRAIQKSGAAFCGNTIQRSRSNLARMFI
jgi:hypothetical protein